MVSFALGATPPPIVRLLRPFQLFLKNKAAGGILLLGCTLLALLWANSPWAGIYTALWDSKFTIGIGSAQLSKPLLLWINDGLMAIFFFLVGLEIKREILVGELASPRQAALPIAAAAGGVVIPAILYTLLNAGGPGAAGWGIPMATDIAFALGVLALLGKRIPLALTIFLTALAIVDDIAAVLVIAIFYTAEISTAALIGGAGCVVVLTALNLLHVRWPIAYIVIGLLLWLAVLKSGIHATVAGVVLAFFIPSRTRIDPAGFVHRARGLLSHFERAPQRGSGLLVNDEQQAALHALEEAAEDVQSPLHRLEHALHPWVSFLIMPVFAFANAGVILDTSAADAITHPVPLGVFAGLLLGKPAGIFFAAWLAVRLGIAELPSAVRWSHIHGAGWLGGIGFTMSLFVASLAFGTGPMLALAKLGILAASASAACIGSILLLRIPRQAS